MTPAQQAIQKLKFRRIRTLRGSKLFCATCGERRWWVRYELHHIAGRKYSDEMIRLCLNCHNGISIMQNLLSPLDDDENPPRARLIAQLEGSALLHELAAQNSREVADMLRGLPSAVPPSRDEGGTQ